MYINAGVPGERQHVTSLEMVLTTRCVERGRHRRRLHRAFRIARVRVTQDRPSREAAAPGS
jgi:hypothetical protein